MNSKLICSFTVQGWMYNLGFSNLNHLLAYAIIYKFCRGEKSISHIDISEVLAENLMCDKSEIPAILNAIRNKGLITITNKEDYFYINITD